MDTLTWASLSSTLTYVGSVVLGAAAVLHWIYREINNLRSEILALRVEVVRDYVNVSSLRHLEERLEASILRLEDRLDRILTLIDTKVASKPVDVRSK